LRFPEFEGGWVDTKLENVAEKINSGKTPLGGESTYKTEGIVFIRSQNVNNDRLELEHPVFISEEINTGMKNSIVKANDILLNITGASLGRSCVVPEYFKIGNVNQHVCIIRSKKEYNPRFIQPILSSNKGQNIFESLQTGSGREGLNFESIKKINLCFPFLKEQTKIADFLALIDQRIDTQSKIIEGLRSFKNMLRDRLFKQIKEDQYDEFCVKSLLAYEQPNKYIVNNTDYSNDNSLTPVLTANKSFVLGYTDELSGTYNKGECIIFDDFTMDIKYVNFPFKIKSSAIKILTARTKVNLKFMFEYLAFLNLTSSEHKRHYISEVETMSVIMPTYINQYSIANTLSKFDEKIKLEVKLAQKLQQQKQYLLQNMFI
jgi:type I restriction enzyme S subunit